MMGANSSPSTISRNSENELKTTAPGALDKSFELAGKKTAFNSPEYLSSKTAEVVVPNMANAKESSSSDRTSLNI